MIETKIKKNAPLSKYTTFGIGGPADLMALPQTVKELKEVLDFVEAEGIPFFILGGGSNVLFKDEGFRGMVIRMSALNGIEFKRNIVEVEAGMNLTRLINLAAREGLSGLEPLYGIPGEIGGAVVMNAGSFGREIRELLTSAKLITWEGEEVELPVDELGLSYRRSKIPEMGVITSVKLELVQSDPDKILDLMQEYLEKRTATQPYGERTAGCVFKNPREPHPPAGELLEKVGLKGYRIGGAKYSEIHANFIVNSGSATFRDVVELIELGKKKVREEFGIELEEEVVVVKEI